MSGTRRDQAENTELYQGSFNYYVAGIYSGRIRFTKEKVMHAAVDSRRRTQMQENVLSEDASFAFPFSQLHRTLESFANALWSGPSVTLDSGAKYERHIAYDGTVNGHSVQSQVFARREDTALDVVVVDERIVGFVVPNRAGMEVIVRPGFEAVTPLVVYDNQYLSKPEYGVNPLGTYLVSMRDDVRLATDVYLPEGISEGETVPTILVRTCYDRNRNKSSLMRYVNRGYAVVNQDVRGRSDSEGELVPFYYERDDGSDTIDWIVKQPWSDGNVGMWGASYLGYVVMAAATSGNQHLKAVVDEVNVGSPFVDTVRRGGTVCSWPLLSWTLAQSVGTRTDFSIFAGDTVNPQTVVDARPIREIPQQVIGHNSKPWDLWAMHPEYDDFWRNCTFSLSGDKVKTPIMVISGWYDGDSAGVSETWRMLTEHDVPHRKIWLGPWEHGPNRARDFAGVHFSNDSVVYDYDVSILMWFDRYLKGIQNKVDTTARATYYVVGENRWRTSSDWPPVESKVVPFYLTSAGFANSSYGDGELHLSAPWNEVDESAIFAKSSDHTRVADADSYTYNPNEPVDDGGEREPENLRKIELRGDILVYTSQPLRGPLTIAGELSAVLYAASSGVDTDWVVSLSDVDEEGNSLRLSNYIVRAKYRDGFDAPKLLVPGKVEKYTIFLPNIGHRFATGHRIRLTVTSSSKFVSFPNTNTGLNPYEDAEPIVVKQTIYHTDQYRSHVLLPILE